MINTIKNIGVVLLWIVLSLSTGYGITEAAKFMGANMITAHDLVTLYLSSFGFWMVTLVFIVIKSYK